MKTTRNELKKTSLIMLLLLAGTDAKSAQFELSDDVRVSMDTTLSYGASYRMEAQDKALIAKANGGTGDNSALINSDDGNRNFKKGDRFSEVAKLVTEIDANYKADYGVFVRGRGFYDFELNDRDRRQRQLSDDAKEEVGSSWELLDAFFYGGWQVYDHRLNLRLGRQVINWGEGLFYQNGIGSTNPVDINALRAPGSELKEAYLPTKMAYISFEVSDTLNIEGYWQPSSAWEGSKVDPCGTYYSTLDVIGAGCDYLSVAPIQENLTNALGDERAFDTLDQAQDYADALPSTGAAGAIKSLLPTTFTPRGSDINPDKDQWGVALRWFLPELNYSEFGFYYLNYNMQVPMLGLTAGQPINIPGVGGVPVANTSEYYAEYLEDRSLYGLSFNTTIGGDNFLNGLSLAGELSFRPDAAIPLGLGEYLPLALSGATTGIPVGTRLDGYHEKDMYQLSLVGIYNFNGLLRSDSTTWLTELVGSYVDELNPNIDYYSATDYAYAIQTQFSMNYPNVFNLFNVLPSLGFSYGIDGIAPQLTNGIVEDAKSISLGVNAVYQESLSVEAKFTGYSGGGLSNKRSDRDFMSLNIKYTF